MPYLPVDHPDDHNPFAPPSTRVEDSIPDRSAPDLRLFLAWEKYRILYNAILGVETLLLLASMPPRFPRILVPNLLACCLAANVCFCLGPVLDGYARLIGLRSKVISWLIFGAGTTLAALLAYVAILFMHQGLAEFD